MRSCWMDEVAARSMMLAVTPVRPGSIRFKDLRLEVMSRIMIRKTRVGEIAAELKKDGHLRFPNWEPRRRVPQDDYLVHRWSDDDVTSGSDRTGGSPP